MKKILSLILVVCMIVNFIVTLIASAEEVIEGNCVYEVANGEATLVCWYDNSVGGDITIPSTLGGYPVTSIGPEAFLSATKVTSVTIPISCIQFK